MYNSIVKLDCKGSAYDVSYVSGCLPGEHLYFTLFSRL